MDGMTWRRFGVLYAQVEHELSHALQRGFGLGLSEYRALCLLAATPDGELRMQELARGLALNQSTVTRLVARLERAELTRKDLCPKDLRGVYTVITDAGRTSLATAKPVYERTLAESLAAAAADPELSDIAATINTIHPPAAVARPT